MAASAWQVPKNLQPDPADYAYDLDQALTSMVGLSAIVPVDAFTAETLGTERAGNGVVIDEKGLVLTIGYLITEAESVWLTSHDGRTTAGHPLAYDFQTGFGLVQALGPLGLPALELGRSASLRVDDDVVVAGAGGRRRSVAAKIRARQEFAGYWEYLLDEALFTSPPHPHWGGTALLDDTGALVGIGSLLLQEGEDGERPMNMFVPIDLLPPILDDLRTIGRANRPPAPWLGVYAAEVEGRVVVAGLAAGGPAEQADIRPGDVLLAVAGSPVHDLAGLYRRIRALGPAGVEVPLTIMRDDTTPVIRVASSDRTRFLKGPVLH